MKYVMRLVKRMYFQNLMLRSDNEEDNMVYKNKVQRGK